ncbi:hypothetical protein M0Q97_07585 [Candidatus Dojkabacteria bacterium]|jgi:hypothetical protein|nr:hypothetical protein [Candidatus Dojkabacteria bacterium]
MNIISDIEWKEFVDDGIVSQDIIDIISIRIKYNYELTDRELAIGPFINNAPEAKSFRLISVSTILE